MLIADLQLTIQPTTALYTNIIADANIAASESSSEGRKAIVLDFYNGDGVFARDMGTIFSWPITSQTVLYVWQPSIIPQPENVYGRPSDWQDGGYAGAKFIQGYIIEANSFGVPKTFQLESSDDASVHSLLETPATFGRQTEIAFSCSPFISHSVRTISTDGVPWQVFRGRPLFTPYPELLTLWTTELLNFGLGWQHVRMLNIPYIASAPITITLEFDQWPTITLTNILPATSSQLYPTKTKVQCPANKSKLIGFQLQSASPFRVFKESLEVYIGVWGRRGPYVPARPFGGESGSGLLIPAEYKAELQ